MKPTLLLAAAALAATLGLVSCSTGGRSPSGFLGNYAQLNSGYGTEDAVSAFVNPEANFRKYDSVIFEPVTTVVASPAATPAVTDQLAAYLSEALRKELGARMAVVGMPGPSTMRVRVALTDVIEGSSPAGVPVRQVHTAPQATLTGKLGSPELAAFISQVSFEGEIVDSMSGERLSALIDHRLGKKREASPDTSWAGVRSATSQGAKRLADRFFAARGN